MTNKEANKYLIRPFATSTRSYNEYLKQREAYDLAIKVLEEKPKGEWEAVGFVGMKYAWCRCSKCHKTTKIYLDSSNEFCCISDIRKKAVACLYCGVDMRKE